MPQKVLIVDDHADLRASLREFLEQYAVLEAASGEDALSILRRANDIALVILDVMMPGISGLDVLTEIKKTDPRLGVIILTGHSSKDVAIEALKGHADDYIEKPIKLQKLQDAVDTLMARRRGEPDPDSLDIEGKMKKVRQFIEDNCLKKISLEDAAAAVSLSPKYLSRAFKQQMKTGFNEYKIKVKIGKGKDLLANYGYTVNQIALKLGYENPESFFRQFKKITGCAPSDYRSRMKAKQTRKAKQAKKGKTTRAGRK